MPRTTTFDVTPDAKARPLGLSSRDKSLLALLVFSLLALLGLLLEYT